jgi:hypothetical protein
LRPHSSLNYLTPNEFVARGARPAPRQATGRTYGTWGLRALPPGDGPDAAVHGDSAPRPVARPSRRDTCSQRRKPSQANRGPKNQGRSRFASSVTTFILWTEEKSPASGSGWARLRAGQRLLKPQDSLSYSPRDGFAQGSFRSSTAGNRFFLSIAAITSPTNSPIFMFRNSASNASCLTVC